jgi:hypothetical protein
VLPRVVEQATRVHHRADIAQRFKSVGLARSFHVHGRLVQVNGDLITGLQYLAQPLATFSGIKLARGHAVAKEDAGEALGHDDAASGRAERDWGMLARAAAAEIAARHNNREGAI